MNWTEVIRVIFKFLEKPTSKSVLAMTILGVLLAYSLPLLIVTGAFIYVGDKVVVHVEQGFSRIERILERREIAIK